MAFEATGNELDGRVRTKARIRSWNKRIHFYIGLYFLLFIWLFSISGLLLNNSQWRVARFWEERVETVSEQQIRILPSGDDTEVARLIMAELSLEGEINAVERDLSETSVQVSRPGVSLAVVVDHETLKATIKRTEVNGSGVLANLHAFSGVSMTDPSRVRDWTLTRLWSLAMDALAIGLIVLVASGIYLWYQLPRKRLGGVLALLGGSLACGIFLLGFIRFM